MEMYIWKKSCMDFLTFISIYLYELFKGSSSIGHQSTHPTNIHSMNERAKYIRKLLALKSEEPRLHSHS